jgi:drug/metabolite transporter (DMT)-like permease
MSWLYYALLFPITSSISQTIQKSLTKKVHHLIIALSSLLFSLPFLFLIVLYIYGIPQVDRWFWFAIAGSAFLNIFATVFSFTALKISNISILAPISAFNPVFTTIIAFLILGEVPSTQGLLGILLVGLGGYFLNISQIKKGLLEPIKTLLLDKGVRLMLISYLIWAVTPVLEKTAINHTFPQTPPFVAFVAGVLLLIGVTPIVLLRVKRPGSEILQHWKQFAFIGAISALGTAAIFIAFSLTLLGYVTAISKTSMFFTIVLAHIFLKEKAVKERFLGALIMFAGVLLIVS